MSNKKGDLKQHHKFRVKIGRTAAGKIYSSSSKVGGNKSGGGSSNRRYIKEIDDEEYGSSYGQNYDQNIIYMFYKSKGMQ